jgi:hypothetical protein
LFIAYYASAELGCYLALDWPFPCRILDLYAEFRRATCGLPVPCGHGLLGALAYYGIDGLAAAEKVEMRDLAMRGGLYTPSERKALLTYCQTDVDALAALLPCMLPSLDLPRALLRGRYMAAVAKIEWQGIPLDVETLEQLRQHWEAIKGQLIRALNAQYQVFIPAGHRPITGGTPLGAALLRVATQWDCDVYALARALDYLWQEARALSQPSQDARRVARRATGLTATRLNRWEDAGHDSSRWSGLDEDASELAYCLPELGIGPGYADGAYDDTDYAGRLWEVLRAADEQPKSKQDLTLLQQAADLVTADPDGWAYTGQLTFSSACFAQYLARQGLPWPRLPSGQLALDDGTFREMARVYPDEIAPLRELRSALSQLRLSSLAVGVDGRNRCLLSAFGSRSSRNQPSNSRYIFGPSTWLRSLIKPGPGWAVAYIDWSQQELGIAAVLSGDQAMLEAYQSGDFYLTFAKMAGAVPADATKQSHPAEREQFKTLSLGVLYGLSAESLARKLGVPPCRGRELLPQHKEVFRAYWRWSDRVEIAGMLAEKLQTVFGWQLHAGPNPNPRSLRNFPMQANGAEMMRVACGLATERGLAVCGVVHDALLVEALSEDIEDRVARTQAAMEEASLLVLPGFPLRTEAKIVRYPERYMDPRGQGMWETVMQLLPKPAMHREVHGQGIRYAPGGAYGAVYSLYVLVLKNIMGCRATRFRMRGL